MAAPAQTPAAQPTQTTQFSAPKVESLPVAAISAPRLLTRTIGGITFEGVAFDSRSHKLSVLDQAAGPGSKWPDAASAGKSASAIAAINAGFFTPEGAPLGKVVAGGDARGSWNRASSLGSGVWWESPAGKPSIARRDAVAANADARELIQAGPLLIDHGKPVTGLEANKAAVRILVLWDGTHRWWIGRASSCTLNALGQAVHTGQPAGWQARHGLNLDGGRSADLWVSASVQGGPLLRRSVINRPVRNFLALIPK